VWPACMQRARVCVWSWMHASQHRPARVMATWQAWLDEQLHQGDMEEVGQTLAAASVQLPAELPTGGGAPMEPTSKAVVEAEEVRCRPTDDGLGAPPAGEAVPSRCQGAQSPSVR
jgi:hypothetical protein